MRIEEDSSVPIYRQIYDQIHQGIADGVYPQGSKLPSIRGLAEELKCSRNTVEAAYGMLVEEGLVASRPGSGYRVQDHSQLVMNAGKRAVTPAAGGEARVRYDFTYGNLEAGTFPAAAWRAIVDDLLLSVESSMCDIYTDPLGEEALRSEIAWRLNTQRDVDCTPAQVVIQGGHRHQRAKSADAVRRRHRRDSHGGARLRRRAAGVRAQCLHRLPGAGER